uniref:Protein V2 n=1 Tax=Mungbean yellow mosaic virus TaxID=33726 RepID=A0A6B9PEN0_9GEMI|nr:precoat protein [Mungbean yellow mosaic virus]QHD57729.1 precoat protein [Mungbean yellow mosaic virus]UVJ68679.1 pre-coat protein [Mungbean yellow mosaic virus]UYO78265.1 AV2 [Mungbean yellow mosaic virus]WJJ67068.1 pre-coat protein [Mungbean yellow mosaic virus]
MWDPLVNDFPKSLHGFRCMLAIKYLQYIQENYPSNSLGYVYLTELIQVLRIRKHAKAELRYRLLYPDVECAEEADLRHPAFLTCHCGKCPCQREKEEVDQPTHVEETEVLSVIPLS